VIECAAAPVVRSFSQLCENGRDVTIGNALEQAVLPHPLRKSSMM
jgi:hypothetical protein